MIDVNLHKADRPIAAGDFGPLADSTRSRARQMPARCRGKGQQQGFALITAVFIMLLLSAVAVTIAETSITHFSITTQAVRRVNTELALKSATQWYLASVTGDGRCEGPPNLINKSINFDEFGRFTAANGEGIVATIVCADADFSENGASVVLKPATLTAQYRSLVAGGAGREPRTTRAVRLDAI